MRWEAPYERPHWYPIAKQRRLGVLTTYSVHSEPNQNGIALYRPMGLKILRNRVRSSRVPAQNIIVGAHLCDCAASDSTTETGIAESYTGQSEAYKIRDPTPNHHQPQ